MNLGPRHPAQASPPPSDAPGTGPVPEAADAESLAIALVATGMGRLEAAREVGRACGWAVAWGVAPTPAELPRVMGDDEVREMFRHLAVRDNWETVDLEAAPGSGASLQPFGIGEVERILAYSEGRDFVENCRTATDAWLLVCRLADQRVAFLSMEREGIAWASPAITAVLGTDLDQILQHGMEQRERVRLGFPS